MNILNTRTLKRIKTIGASKEHPFIVCRTCGLTTDKVILRHSDSLRHIPHNTPHRFKTWNRTVKYSNNYKSSYHNRICRAKEIFFSYLMLDCITRKHRLSVRKAPFSSSLVSVVR